MLCEHVWTKGSCVNMFGVRKLCEPVWSKGSYVNMFGVREAL